MAKEDLTHIINILDDYSNEIQNGIEEAAKQVSKDGAKRLKAESPVNKKKSSHRGRYAKGWTAKTEKGFGWIKCIIYNKTDWQLTHLLENGHLDRKGGWVKPIPHIKDVEQASIKEYEKIVKDVIKKGGK